jgi:CSLREA domain-containing protein
MIAARASIALIVFGSIGLLSSPAQAVTFTVNSTTDASDAALPRNGICETAPGNGVCTLRAAIEEANATTDAIVMIPAGTYPLQAAHGRLYVYASATIVGAGAAATIVDASLLNDVPFSIYGGLTVVHISGLAVQDASDSGVVIGSYANVTMNGVTIHHCSTTSSGGGIRISSGTLTMNDCTIDHCTSAGPGGGIFNDGDSVTLTRTTIDHCSAGGNIGGGISQHSGDLNITATTLSASSASYGGGLFIQGYGNTPLITTTTINGNTASSDGGGIYVSSRSLDLVDSTVSGNSAAGSGGGIFNYLSATALYSSTVTGNQADSDLNGTGSGGGVNSPASSTLTFIDSIIAMNSESQPFFGGSYTYADGDCVGAITSQGHSILNNYATGPTGCTVAGSFILQDPKLAVLANNGGPTRTHALLAGSPAINAGDNSLGGCKDRLGATIATDQRGVHRPLGAACDIGAYESGSPHGDVNGDGVVDVADVFALLNFLFAGGTTPAGLADVNGDAAINVADVFYLINFLFAGGPLPT